MNFSTQFTSKFSTFILVLFIAAGCAGINDANFSQDTEKAPILEERDYQAERPASDTDPILTTEEQEDIRVLRPPHDD
ncbi:MAG: hypothetical protein WD267_07865 [Balneolales bacterium]